MDKNKAGETRQLVMCNQGLLWLVGTLIQLVDQSFQASQLNQTKRLVGVWLTDFYLHAAKQTG